MRSDDILDQIDSALHDWTVSDDAMRSAPEPLPLPGRVPVVEMRSQPEAGTISLDGASASVMVMDEAGEWQELGGVRSIDFHIQPPQIDPEFQRTWQEFREHVARVEAERIRRARAVIEAFGRAYIEAVKPAAESAARALAALQEALQRDVGTPNAPGRRDGRPAWQSPYGPPRRRR
ncbi:hypothetical protein ACH4F6_31620 [Streptomyces sp. NPDC017936]|uniref:hypothetical protein n=1 Tax=Streptomyces sp. NPDC017936 TaxID=3365016 RepID=UPI003791000B